MINIIAQCIGLLGFLSAIISFQNNDRQKILILQILANILFSIHFFMLGSITGSALNLVSIFRGVIFYKRDYRKWANHILFMYLFIALFSIVGLATYKNLFSLLPILGTTIGTVGLWVKSPRKIRFIMITASPCWLIYNIYIHSIAGILTESFSLVSIAIAIIRFEVVKKS